MIKFFDLNSFKRLGQKSKNNTVGFLVQMRTRKFAFEINWPLLDWNHQGFICFLKFHNVFAQKPLLYFISRHMSINSCWWNVSSSALERVLFSFPAWNGICRDFLKVEIQKNLQIKAKNFTFGNYLHRFQFIWD